MRTFSLILIFIFLFSATSIFASKKDLSFPKATYVLNGKATDNTDFTLKFTTDKKGKIQYLEGNLFNYVKEQFADKNDAIDNLGFYNVIPAGNFKGSCKREYWADGYCIIRINFTDEEISTLFVNFDMLYLDNGLKYSGTIFETHSDQGMTLYHKSFEF